MSLQEQINKRIANYKATITGISDDVMTDWHRKQNRALMDRIEELEWVLKTIETEVKNKKI